MHFDFHAWSHFLFLLDVLTAPAESRLDRTVLDAESLTVVLTATAPNASCPLCGSNARRVQSRYTRKLADLPCFGRSLGLLVTVRRFYCPKSDGPRRIFTERLEGFAPPHARTTARLDQAHSAIGYALGGEAGARLAMPTSPDTLLRRVKHLQGQLPPAPRFVGIDDWAWRKGRRYGTIVVDLERSQVIDLLPDRDAKTVKNWLEAHPDVELVSRDRWSEYAQATTEAASQAQQVADRWHLLKNLREAIERLFERQSAVVGEALKPAATASESTGSTRPSPDPEATLDTESLLPRPPSEPAPESPRAQARRAKRQRRVDRFEQVHKRQRQGHSARRIARELGLSRNSVLRYLRSEKCPDWGPGRPRSSQLDAYREEIDARLAEGCTNAAQLHRELGTRGFRGSASSVRAYVTKRLGAAGKKRARVNAAEAPPSPAPSPKQLSFEWVRRRENRKPAEEARLNAIRTRSAELSSALDLADEFAELVRKRSKGSLSDWLAKGEASSCPEVRRFAEGIRRDEAAVQAAVSQKWSNGPVEGQVNRLKMIKRQMYGRAGFVLLKARVIKVA
jgi:transposase